MHKIPEMALGRGVNSVDRCRRMEQATIRALQMTYALGKWEAGPVCDDGYVCTSRYQSVADTDSARSHLDPQVSSAAETGPSVALGPNGPGEGPRGFSERLIRTYPREALLVKVAVVV